MRDNLFASVFHFLYRVVQEEIQEDGIDVSFGVLFHNLPAEQFHAPDTAGCKMSA